MYHPLQEHFQAGIPGDVLMTCNLIDSLRPHCWLCNGYQYLRPSLHLGLACMLEEKLTVPCLACRVHYA